MKSMTKDGSRILFLLLMIFFSVQTLSAQVDLTWTGLVSTDATNQDNWDPQQPPDGNNLIIDSAYKYTNLPVFMGSDSVLINNLTLQPTGVMTIAFDDSLAVLDIATETPFLRGIINIDHGKFRARRCELYYPMEMHITSGGIFEPRKYLFFSNGNEGSQAGGFVYLSGTGLINYTAEQADYFGRFPADTTTGIYTIEYPARMNIKHNYVDLIRAKIATLQVRATEGYEVVVQYDEENDWTYVFTQDATLFVIEPPDVQVVTANQEGNVVRILKNEGYDAMASYEWKYSTTSGSGYVSFDPPQVKDTIVPIFTEPGHYYLICQGTLKAGGIKNSNEVEFYVGSDLLTITPGSEQYLKPGKDGALLTVVKDASITSGEWKYSNTLGSGYTSFDPAQTADELTPNFAEEGIYYLVYEGSDGSTTYMSKNLKIKVDNLVYNITWNGSAGNSSALPNNWTPIANPNLNALTVPVRAEYGDSLVFNSPGNLAINKLFMANDATTTVDMGNDTLYVSNNSYGIRNLHILSGVMNYRDLRLEGGTIHISGGVFHNRSNYFMMANKNGNVGGFIFITGDGVVRVRGNQPDRFSTVDTTISRIYITDNGLFDVIGDWRAAAEPIIARLQIYTDETREIVMEYDETNDRTLIFSKELVVFGIAPEERQVVEVDENIATLEAINDEDVTAYEWKYSGTQGGPYTAFDPAQTGNTLTVSFSDLGDYYVVCEGTTSGDPVVSNEVLIQVAAVSIAPVEEQNILVAEEGTALTVTETVAPDFRDWKKTSTPGSGYTSVVPAEDGTTYTPLFLSAGTFYVVCASTYGEKTILSNEVTIIVSEENSIDDPRAGIILVYPNPAKNKFRVDAGNHTNYSLTVTDITGKVVLTRQFENVSGPQEVMIDGHVGVYFLQIDIGNEVYNSKLVLE
ncbi:MAG: T9SS type A sorting domain-containing protein [Bacteroidales bacterium]|nr:T9SS type A sorting domain-containing protein [Bacteroidales bacterium]MBN2697188.1 T9SS type A sorting domain-containing protein [Bacteroidales bacterium]